MKKIALILLGSLSGTVSALAHQAEGGSTAGLFGLKPEYVHTLLNPLPVYGLLVGVLVLLAGILTKNRGLRTAGLVVTILCAVSAYPVLLFGQHGYNHLAPQLDTESKQWLDTHMDRAEHFIYAFYLTAAIGVAALALPKKFVRSSTILLWLTIFCAVITLGIGGWISRSGGEVSHSEFRGDQPPDFPANEHSNHNHN
jgi:hypothetical protein